MHQPHRDGRSRPEQRGSGVTTPTIPPGDLSRRSPNLARGLIVVVPFFAGVAAMIVALVGIVVIRPLGWRLLATFLLWIPGAAALILFSDGLDQLFPGRQRRRWVVEALHWLSGSLVALALVVVLGAFVPSLFGMSVSPAFWPALGCDALIGALAGFATFLLVASGGWAGEKLAYLLRRMGWIEDDEPKRPPVSFWGDWSWRDGLRMVVLSIAGVQVSGGVTQLFVAAPSNTTGRAADSAPSLPPVWTSIVVPLAVWFLVTGLVLVRVRPGRKRVQTAPRATAGRPLAATTRHTRKRAGGLLGDRDRMDLRLGVEWLDPRQPFGPRHRARSVDPVRVPCRAGGVSRREIRAPV